MLLVSVENIVRTSPKEGGHTEPTNIVAPDTCVIIKTIINRRVGNHGSVTNVSLEFGFEPELMSCRFAVVMLTLHQQLMKTYRRLTRQLVV